MKRGVAMLVVLAALAIGISAAALAARVATVHALTARLDACEATADDALAAAGARIEWWLGPDAGAAGAGAAVVPPDSPVPALAVAADIVELGPQVHLQLRISAFDQRGMVPWPDAAKGTALARAGLPPDAADAIARSSLPKDVPAGIDVAASSARRPLWPVHVPGPRAEFGNTAPGEFDGAPDAAPGVVPLAALVSTHADGTATLNVNTAPIALLEDAERLSQRSVSAAARQARSAGKRAAAPASEAATGPGAPASVQFTASSDCWSFRIDIRVGPVTRAWWATYRKSGDGWRCVQRLRIDP